MPRTDTAFRVIGARREEVFAALVDPDALASWLPPEGMTGRIEQFDPRAGGSYRMVLTYAEPSAWRGKSAPDADVVDARFVELVPGERVVYAVNFASDDPSYAGTMTVNWVLTPVDGGTRVDVTAENVADAVSEEDHLAGMASSLAHLAIYLGR